MDIVLESIDYVENLQPGFELDKLILNEIFCVGYPDDYSICKETETHFSTNVFAAFKVIEKMMEKCHIIIRSEAGFWSVDFYGDGAHYKCAADTVPLAVCRAALLFIFKLGY